MSKILQKILWLRRIFTKKNILKVIVISLLFGMLGETYNMLILNRQKSMVIEFNYPGVEKGLNPDGSPFEIANLKSDEVLERAKEQMQYNDIDTAALKSRIFITSKITATTMDKIVSAVQNEKNITYLPTTFYVYYSQKNKLSPNESSIFMQSLADAYTEYFNDKYSEKNNILVYNSDEYDFENSDYQEIYEMLSNKIDSMISFIRNHQQENRAFYSQDLVNLGTAVKRLESFRDVSMKKFYSFIVQNSISKDNDAYVKRVAYIIDDKSFDYKKLKDSSDIAKAALERYEPNITAVVFVPSVDSKHNYYMSRTKTGLDDITKLSYEDGMSAARMLQEIEYYRNLYNKFSYFGDSEISILQQADSMVADLSGELEKISQEVLKTDNEYLEHKTKNYLKIRLPEERGLINLSLIAKFMILGFVLSAAAIIVRRLFEEVLKRRFEKLKAMASAIVVGNKNGE